MKYKFNIAEEGCINLIGAIVWQAKDDYIECAKRIKKLNKKKSNLSIELKKEKRERPSNRVKMLEMGYKISTYNSRINHLTLLYNSACYFLFVGDNLNKFFERFGVDSYMNAGYVRKKVREEQ